MKLRGRRILITGGGSGIGLELATRLAPDNDVVISGRDERKLEQARGRTPELRTLGLDVTSEEDAQRTFQWLSHELGGLDLLVNKRVGHHPDLGEGSSHGSHRSLDPPRQPSNLRV